MNLALPSSEEIVSCGSVIGYSIDALPDYLFGSFKEINYSIWYTLSGNADDAGLSRYLHSPWAFNPHETLPSASTKTFHSVNFTVDWTNDYLDSWYFFGIGVYGGGMSPHIYSHNPPDPRFSTATFTYSYSTTPAIKSISNEDTLLLSATSPADNTNLATIVLNGTGTTNMTIQMPNTATDYTVEYDSVSCDASNPNCSFTQSAGELTFTGLVLGSEHTLEITGDTTPPSGGSIAYTDGYETDTTATIEVDEGTDAESGISSVQLSKKEASLSDGNCGAFGDWAIEGTQTTGTTSIDVTTESGKCYQFKYEVTNGVDLTAIYESANVLKVESAEPIRSAGSPTSVLPVGTTQTTLSLTTDETATCKYSTAADTAYGSMTSFTTTNDTSHSTTITGLSDGNSYSYYVKCQDVAENINSTDYTISFSVDAAESEPETPAEETPVDTDDNTENTEDLEISSVKSTSTDTTITITWKTNRNAKGYVRYGTDKNLTEKKKENKKKKKHQLTLRNPTPSTQYYFKITEETDDGAIDRSKIHTITTLPSVESNQSPKLNIEIQDYDESEEKKEEIETGEDRFIEEEKKEEQAEKDKDKKESDKYPYEGESFTTNLFKENNKKYVETVKFQITDNQNQLIPDLKVTLHSDPQTVQTDKQGMAVFQNVELGTHTLAFNHQNKNFKKKVAIGGDSDKEGIVQANVIVIKAVKDPLPWWVWGVGGCLAVALIFTIIYFKSRKKTI